jgi:hypothetical protein
MMSAAHSDLPGPPLMLHALAKSWWLVLLRGISAIVFGVLAFMWQFIRLQEPRRSAVINRLYVKSLLFS